MADPGQHPAVGQPPAQAVEFPGCLPDDRRRRRVPDIKVAGAVLLAEVVRIEYPGAGHLVALIGVPVHGMRIGIARIQGEPAAAGARDSQHRRLISGIGPAHDLGDLLILRVQTSSKPRSRSGHGPVGKEGNRDIRPLQGTFAGAVLHRIRNGLRVYRRVDIGIDRDGEPPPEADLRAGAQLHVTRQCFLHRDHALVDFGIVEVGRKLHRARLLHACRLAHQHIRKGRSAAAIQVVRRPHEEVQVALRRAGLGQRGFQNQVVCAPKVHAIPQTQHRPMALAASPRKAGPRTPLVPEIR